MTAVPPPPPPGYEAPRGKVRLRGRIPLRLALVFGVLGVGLIVAGAIVLATSPFGKVPGFGRVSIASGSGTVHLGSGDYLAYYEADGLNVGRDPAPDLSVVLTSPTGKKMALDDLYGNSTTTVERLTYHTDGHDGAALYEFHLDRAGTYHVDVTANSDVPPDADLAFGRSIAGGLVTGVLLLLPGIFLFVAAVVLFVVGLVRRSRHKNQLAAYPPGSPPPYYPPPGTPRYRGVG